MHTYIYTCTHAHTHTYMYTCMCYSKSSATSTPLWVHRIAFAAAVCELSLNLAMLEQPQLQARCCAEHPAAVCERLVVRHFHQLASLLLLRRNDLVMAFYLSNCLSGYVGECCAALAVLCCAALCHAVCALYFIGCACPGRHMLLPTLHSPVHAGAMRIGRDSGYARHDVGQGGVQLVLLHS